MKAIIKNSIHFLFLSFLIFLSGSTSLAQVWNREVIDSTGINMGAYCSLEIDQNNNPHIAYMDADFYDLKYAIRTENKWHVTTLDSLRYTGVSCDLAIDSKNQPHICFQEGCQMAAQCPGAGLKYMTKTSEGWLKESVDEYFVVTGETDQSYCSMQINSEDKPVIAYYKIGQTAVNLAYKSGETWNYKEYSLSVTPIYLSLQLKSDDSPVIQYLSNDSLHAVVYNVTNDTWHHYGTAVVPFSMILHGGYNFDIDQNDHLHFIFPSFENGMPHYKYIYFDWQDWVKEFYGVNAPYFIEIDKNNIPQILSLEGSNGLSICKKDNVTWDCEEIAQDLYTDHASLDFDTNNNPQFALYGNLPEASEEKSGLLMYYSFNPGNAGIDVSSGQLDFENVWIQSYLEKKLIIRNTGVADLAIGNLKFESNSSFQIINQHETAIIPAGDSLEVTIRFTPALAQSYSEILQLICNDPNHPLFNINLTGKGIASGSTANLYVQVNDVFADMDYLIINQDNPLEGVKVEILQNNQNMAGSVTTASEGMAPFGNLAPGFYEVKISKMLILNEEQTLLASSEIIEVGPGANTHLMLLPDSLYQYKYQLLDELNKIHEADYLLTNEYFSYENIETKVDDQFKLWATNYDPDITESLARLILVETMVKDLFEEGIYVSNEMFADFGNLIGFIYYMDDWGMSILEFLKTAIKSFSSIIEGGSTGAADLFNELVNILKEELIKRSILLSITEAVELVGSELDHPADQILMTGWKEVKAKYSSMPNLSFGSVEWDEITKWVSRILKDPFIQIVYIELQTSPSIQKALDYSIINTNNGSFTKAGHYEINYVSDKKNDVETDIGWASDLRETANLFMVSANILEMAGAIDPTGVLSWADEFATTLKISAYTEVITALGISTYEFFNLPAEMKDAVDEIYFPEGNKNKSYRVENTPNRSKIEIFNQNNIKEQLFSVESSYDSILLAIKEEIAAGNRVEAALELFNLRDIDNIYKNQIRQSYAPVCAVAREASDSIVAFGTMYDSLISFKALADQEKIITYLKLFCVAFDSTGQMENSVFSQIDRCMRTNHKLTSYISEMLDLVSSNMEVPGVIVASMLKQEKHSLDMGEDGIITLKMKNVGAVRTDNIRLKVETNDALTYSGPDSIFVGSLEPGEESDEITINLTLASKEFKTALWDINIECDNAETFSPSGSFGIIQSPVGIKGESLNDYSGLKCIPNPLSSTATIFYETVKSGILKIELYDLSGQKIKTLFNHFQKSGKFYFPWNASSLANGMYIIKLQVDNENKGLIRVVVNK